MRTAICLLILALLALLITIPLDWQAQVEFGAITLLIAWILNRLFPHERITWVLMLISIFSSSRYMYWRISESIRLFSENPVPIFALDIFFILLLLAAEIYTFVVLLLGYFQTVRPLRRVPAALP